MRAIGSSNGGPRPIPPETQTRSPGADHGLAPRSNTRPSLTREDQRQPDFRVPDHDALGVLTLRHFHRGLDAFPLEQLLADALRDDALEVGNALRLDGLARGLLGLAVQTEVHPVAPLGG